MERTLWVVERRLRAPGSRRWGAWSWDGFSGHFGVAKDKAYALRARFALGVCQTRIWAFDRRDRADDPWPAAKNPARAADINAEARRVFSSDRSAEGLDRVSPLYAHLKRGKP